MKAGVLEKKIRKIILSSQKCEITEYFIYRMLSRVIKDPHNKKILDNISVDELRHYNFWKDITKEDVNPNRLKVWVYYLIVRLFGLTFGIKLMERGEESAQVTYGKIAREIPGIRKIITEEDYHEKQLINMIDEERLKYVGSMMLGLNDALVELTGALAGFTFALQNTLLIAVVGLITGIAASMSMGASEYLSTKLEETDKSPWRASLYTGVVYMVTVLLLISPFLLLVNVFLALGATILVAIAVILFFNFYISVAKDLPFWRRFLEMVLINLGIAAISFCIGVLIRIFLVVEV